MMTKKTTYTIRRTVFHTLLAGAFLGCGLTGWTDAVPDVLFTPDEPDLTTWMGSGPVAAAIADINNDGFNDVIGIAQSQVDGQTGVNQGIWLQMGREGGTFYGPLPRVTGSNPTDVAIGNFNGDEFPDVITTALNDDRLSILFGFRANPSRQVFVPDVPASYKIDTRDIDGDGLTEVAVVSQTNFIKSELRVFEVVPGASPPLTLSASSAVNARLWDVAFADLDGDNLAQDLLALQSDHINGNIIVYEDLMNGGTTTHPVSLSGQGTSLAVGDIDHDSQDEIVVVAAAYTYEAIAGGVAILDNTVDGIVESVTYSVGSAPTHVVLTDINTDGHLDIVTADYGGGVIPPDGESDTVTILLGRGDGTFLDTYTLSIGDIAPLGLAVGDLNGDTRPDIVIPESVDINLHFFFSVFPSRAELILDMHRDGGVNAYDLFELASEWGAVSFTGNDLNASGQVDAWDMRYFITNYEAEREESKAFDFD